MKVRRTVAVALLTLGLAGCATTHPRGTPAPSPLPPRPFSLPITGLDPCAALSAAQLAQLDVRFYGRHPADENTGPDCSWIHSPSEPIEGYRVIRNVHTPPLTTALDNPRGAAVTTIAGFPAITTQNDHADPNSQCIVLIDVAEDQNLQINYDYTGGTAPMTRELACRKATRAADMAMRTLIAATGR